MGFDKFTEVMLLCQHQPLFFPCDFYSLLLVVNIGCMVESLQTASIKNWGLGPSHSGSVG